jgi:hypothetical protein
MKISVLYSKNGESKIDEVKVTQFERSLLKYKCHHNGIKHFLFNGFLVIISGEVDFTIFWDSEKFNSLNDLSNEIDGNFLKDAMPTIRNYIGITNEVISNCITHLLVK